MEEFELDVYAQQGESLLEEIRQEFQKLGIVTDGLPTQFISADEGLKLVFVGQYSAGKSSIIKMLTGADVEIGAAITTQNSTEYPWHGLSIVDTPGISTELRPDHDEITYDQINHAALLVFVITNEGFNQCIGENFCKLAIEQKRAANMILVVNKMDRTEMGNVSEQRKIITNDIRRVLGDCTPEEVYLSFLDTNSYQESLMEEDEEIRQELLDLSGHDIFVQHLNDFVRKRKLLARLERPLYTIASEIKKAMGSNDEADNEDDADAAVTLVNRKKRVLEEGRKRCLRKIGQLAEECQYKISAAGRTAASAVQSGCDEDDVNKALEAVEMTINNEVEMCQNDITSCLNESLKAIVKDIEVQDGSIFARKVHLRWEQNMEAFKNTSDFGGYTPKQIEKDLSKVSEALITSATKKVSWQELLEPVGTGKEGLFTGLAGQGSMKVFSGSLAHTTIKSLGNFVGIKFQPWQAVRWSSYVGYLGKALGAIGFAYSLYNFFTEPGKKKEQEEKVAQSRTELRKEFDRMAKDICADMVTSAQETMQGLLEPAVAELGQNLENIKQLESLMQKRRNALAAFDIRVQEFMKTIQE